MLFNSEIVYDAIDVSSEDCDILPTIPQDVNNSPNNIYDFIPSKPVEICEITFYPQDFFRLKPSRWLNDKIINAYFKLICNDLPHVYCFSTYFYPIIQKSRVSSLLPTHKFLTEPLDFTKISTEMPQRYKEYYQKYGRILVFPIHLQNHWTVMVYRKEKLYYMDSMGGVNQKAFFYIRKFITQLFYPHKMLDMNIISHHFPPQTNSDDCGVFACQYVKFITYDMEPFPKPKSTLFRKQMLNELLAEKILYLPSKDE